MRFTRTLLLLCWAALLFPAVSAGQCLTPELALINSCIDHPNPNGSGTRVESELLVVSTGIAPVPVAEIGFDLPNNSFGAVNADVGINISGAPLGCTFKEPSIVGLPGCGNVIPLGPLDTIPPNSLVVFITTGTTQTIDLTDVDFSNVCPLGESIYALQNACERTSGAFANGPGSGNPLRTITIISECGLRAFTYNTLEIDPEEGTYYLVGLNEVGNLDCDLPVLPETCPVIDTTFFICDPTSSLPTVTTQDFESIYPNDVLAVSFHPSAIEAEGNDNRITTYIPTGIPTDTIYSRIINSANFCIAIGQLIIQYQGVEATTITPQQPLSGCDPMLTGSGLFNLRLADPEIGNGQPVTYFTDAGGMQEITSPEAYTSSPATIFAQAGILTCQGSIVPVELILDQGPEVTPMTLPVNCPGNTDGSLNLAVTGFSPFAFTWGIDSFAAVANQQSLAAGDYAWSVTDANGCIVSGTTEVLEGGTTQLDCNTVSPVSDSAASDGIIEVSLAEGMSPYQVSYSGAAAGSVEVIGAMGQLTGLPAGDFAIIATDAAGCSSDTCFATVGLAVPILLQCAVRNDADGAGIDGSIQVGIDGGEPPFTVQISGGPGATTLTNQGQGEIVFGNLGVATYTITVTDATGQIETCMQEVMQNNCPLTIADVQLLVSDCSGTDNTIIRLTIAGNDGMINTAWSGGNGIEIFDGLQEAGPLPPGDYFVSVSDQSGCPPVIAGPIQVVNAGPIQSTVDGTFVANACTDEGEIKVSVTSGGTPPFVVQLEDSNGALIDSQTGTAVTFTELPGGDGTPNYRVFVTDALGCSSDTNSVTISTLPVPAIELAPIDQQLVSPTCFDSFDGSLAIMASGGTAPYTYQWLDYPERGQGRVLAPGASQTDLPSGLYVVEVEEATGCIDTFTLSLDVGTRPAIACGATTPAIGTVQGTATINLAGDAPPFQLVYFSTLGEQNTVSNLPAGDTTITFTTPGNYLVTSLDANGCNSDTCSFIIEELPCTVTATAEILPVDCTGEGQIIVNVTGGLTPYAFNWQEPAFPTIDTVAPTVAGSYDLLLTDANGCTLDTSFTVGSLDNAPVFLSDTLAVLQDCFTDSLQVPLNFSGVGPFEFTYSVFTSGVAQVIDVMGVFSAVDTLSIPAGWFAGGGRITASNLADQVCGIPLAQETVDTLIRADTIRRFDVICRPEGLMIGGRQFTAAMPSDTFLVADGSACGLQYEVDITFVAPEALDTMEVFICPGTSFEIPETGDVFNASRREGEVAYPRPGDCDSLVYIRLDIPEVFIGSFNAGACAGDTIFYGDRFFTVDDPAGIARLEGQTSTGCDSLVTVNVNFRRVGELRLLGDHEICPGDSLELRFAYDGPGGINAILEDFQGNTMTLNNVRDGDRVEITPSESTTWSIIAAGVGGCPGTFIGRSVIEVSDISLSTEVLTNPADFCNDTLGRAIALPAGGMEPYSFTWSNGSMDAINPNLLEGTYLVELVDAQGCAQLDSVVIQARQELTARLTTIPPLCEGGSGRLELDSIFGGAGFYEMSLDGSFFLPVDRIGDFRPPIGIGTAFFQDADDCMSMVNYVVPDALRPIFNPLTDTTIFIGDSILLDPQVVFPFSTVTWTPPGTLRSPNMLQTMAVPQQTTDYTLDLVSEDGCAVTYRIRVRVDERLPVYAPSVFSPNGDNVNDVYRLEYGDRVAELLSFQIFNRWGTLMYEGIDGWDGNLDGRPAQSAAYIFQATVRLFDGSERYLKGDFILRR